jgi:hypothetical protein
VQGDRRREIFTLLIPACAAEAASAFAARQSAASARRRRRGEGPRKPADLIRGKRGSRDARLPIRGDERVWRSSPVGDRPAGS